MRLIVKWSKIETLNIYSRKDIYAYGYNNLQIIYNSYENNISGYKNLIPK